MTVRKITFDDDLLAAIVHQLEVLWAKTLLVLSDGRLLILIGESLVLRENDDWRVIIPDAGRSVFQHGCAGLITERLAGCSRCTLADQWRFHGNLDRDET